MNSCKGAYYKTTPKSPAVGIIPDSKHSRIDGLNCKFKKE